MPAYKLSYFDIRGRAEIARLIFACAGVKYEDIRVPRDDWPALKPETPFGQMPVLEVDGTKIGQSVAIANFLAREFGLYGKTSFESATIDQVVCLIQDYIGAAIKVYFEKDEAKKAELEKTHKEETIPKFFGFFEKVLKQNNGGSGYFVGDGITLADLFMYDILWNICKTNPGVLDSSPLLQAHYERIGSNANIKAYVDARKDTPM